MEFCLHVITNGNKANISLEYDNKNDIDKEKLKEAIYNTVDIILSNESISDFDKDHILLNNKNISNEEEPNYKKISQIPPPLEGDNTIFGSVEIKNNKENKENLVNYNDLSYLSNIIVSQIKQDKKFL